MKRLEKIFFVKSNFDAQSITNRGITVFVSAYLKSNFESNFWISQTFDNSLKMTNVRNLVYIVGV